MSTTILTKVSLIIVNYNSSKPLSVLLKSLNNIDEIVKEIIIVDNNSSDIKCLAIPQNLKTKTVIKFNHNNLGFSKAANMGIKLSKSNIVLLLNPDTQIIDKSPILTLKKLIKDKTAIVAGGKMIDAQGNEYLTANSKATFLTGLLEFTNFKKVFPNNKFTRQFWIERDYKGGQNIYVNSLCGAYLFIKKCDNNNRFLFDEKFFLYLEDVDFCNNINERGYHVLFDPSSRVVHIGGYSSNSKYKIVLKHWYKSRKYYFIKNLNVFSGHILYIMFSIEESLLSLIHYLKNEPAE